MFETANDFLALWRAGNQHKFSEVTPLAVQLYVLDAEVRRNPSSLAQEELRVLGSNWRAEGGFEGLSGQPRVDQLFHWLCSFSPFRHGPLLCTPEEAAASIDAGLRMDIAKVAMEEEEYIPRVFEPMLEHRYALWRAMVGAVDAHENVAELRERALCGLRAYSKQATLRYGERPERLEQLNLLLQNWGAGGHRCQEAPRS